MKHHSHPILTGRQLLVAAFLSLSVLGTPLHAQQSDAGQTESGIAATGITALRQINPTTVEVLFSDKKQLTVDFYGQNIFRIFRDDNGGFLRSPAATPPARILSDMPRKSAGRITAQLQNGTAVIASPELEININGTTGLFSVKDLRTGETILEQAAPIEMDAKNVTLTLRTCKDEYFYGGGVQNGRFSHKGQQIAIENTNNWVDGGVASPTPFFWSTKGYGIMWYTFKPGTYDFGATDSTRVVLTHQENYLDAFVIAGRNATELLNGFYQLSGYPVLLPKFAFYEGHLNAYNRDYWKEDDNGKMVFEDGKRYKESQKDNGGIKESLNGEKDNYQFSARAVIDRYAAHDMPLGWLLPNDGYGAGYGQTNSLDGNIQNLKEFGDYARKHGVEIGLWTQSDLHPKEGIEPLLQRDIIKEVRDAGVRVLKTDVAWVGAGYSFGLNGVEDVGNIMPYYGNNARPFIISLDGWAGTQRYAAIWSGDQTGGDWEYIRFHIPTFIGSGLSGQPNITSDVDGIFGGKNLPVNIREFQWKTFTPMELNMDGWGANPKYPHALGEPATSINRWYLKMKSELMPYTYSIAREAIDGWPMIRAMFLEYPNEYTLGSATRYQYMYGPWFIVAPVYQDTQADEKGNDIRDGIYLPEGKWIDYYNGNVYEGNRIINNYNTPIWKLPVFVKSGAIIPMTNPNNNVSQIRKDYRAYEIYADGHTSFREYDDDGVSQEYLDGKSTSTLIESVTAKDRLTVTVHPTEGDYNGFVKEKETEFRINVTAKPKKITLKIGGKNVRLTEVASVEAFEKGENVYFYNERPNLNRFATPGSEFARQIITKNPQIWVRTATADVTTQTVSLDVNGFVFNPADPFRITTGPLQAPKWQIREENIGAYSVTPSWEESEHADYYEIDFNGMLYSTIQNRSLTFDGLMPETDYQFKLRAVNKEGFSEWSPVTVTTIANPLEFAIQGIKAQTSCDNQPGSDIQKLFDFDEKTGWHTVWGKGSIPFDMTLDLCSVNQLDKLEYLPRQDAGNGTLLEGSISYSTDRQHWSTPETFRWERNAETKIFRFEGNPTARYIKISISNATGGFGSGSELYVFKVPGTESVLQGDINKDGKIDENDLTSYMNYTGLRRGDADFEYVSAGDINANGLIDAYDISTVSTRLDGGVTARKRDIAAGEITLRADRQNFKAGDTIEIHVEGKNLKNVNALSFALPYDTRTFEYIGLQTVNMKEMVNLTNDRLHTNGRKALYPTFVNKGNNFTLEGNCELFIIRMKARQDGTFNLKAADGLLVDRNLGTVGF